MLLEPAPTQYDLSFQIFGMPVRVHPMFWLVGAMLGSGAGDIKLILLWIGALFFSIMIHELGHAVVARAFGCRPRIVLFGFGGVTIFERVPSWLARIAITFAGPCAGFLFASILIGGFFFLGLNPALGEKVTSFVESKPLLKSLKESLLILNIFWSAMNLLPVFPLDGGQIARELLIRWNPQGGLRLSLLLSIGSAGLAAVATGYYFRGLFMPLMFLFLAYGSYQQLNSDRRFRF